MQRFLSDPQNVVAGRNCPVGLGPEQAFPVRSRRDPAAVTFLWPVD